MKIKLVRSENDDIDWYEDSDGDIEVEVPDAIITEWRELEKRREEIHAYFEERVRPQIEAEDKRRSAERHEKMLASMTPEQRAQWESFMKFVKETSDLSMARWTKALTFSRP